MMKKTIYIAIVLLVGLSACKSRKQAQVGTISNQMIEGYWANQLNYTFMNMKAKISFTDKGATTNVTANFMMIKDSILWGSFSVFGFEGARVLITKDSFKMLNRLNNTYMVRDLDYLKSYLGFDVKLGELQDIMIGNAPYDPMYYRLIKTDSIEELQAQSGSILNTIGMNSSLQTILSKFSSTKHIQTADFSYGSYKQFTEVTLPSTIIGKIFLGDRNADLDVDYQSANRDIKSSYPFAVPKNYKTI